MCVEGEALRQVSFEGRVFFAVGVLDEQCPRCGKQFRENCEIEPWLDPQGQLVAAHAGCSPVAEAVEPARPDRVAS